MKISKKVGILGSSSFLMLISASLVYAQNFNSILRPFFDLMNYILQDLGKLLVFRQFLIWMLLFSLLTIAAGRVFKEGADKKRGKIIAFILSLIMTLGIPGTVINLLYDEYSLFAFLVMYLLIPALLFIATKDMGNKIIRGTIFIILGVLLGIAASAVNAGTWARSMQEFIGWLWIASSICVILGIAMLVSGNGDDTAGGPTTARGGFGWNPFHRAMRIPNSAAPPAPTFPPSHAGSRRATIDPLINRVHAAVARVHNIYNAQLIPAGRADLNDNAQASHGGQRNPGLSAHYLTTYNNLVNNEIRTAIDAISAVYAHPNSRYMSPAQLSDLVTYTTNLTNYTRDISTYNAYYIRRLARNQPA